MKKVITYGSFDMFHEGHRKLLRRAKALGDYLIVGITTEQYDMKRGKINVVDSLITRIDNVRTCGCVDEIVVEDHEGQKLEDIQRLDIDVFTVGSDWRGRFDYLNEYCEVVYLERTKDISSTELRKHMPGHVRIGVVGNGSIAQRFVLEAKHVSGAIVVGTYNPKLASAQQYAQEYELGFATDNYEEFLEQVNSVYVASPHETHYAYAKQALTAGRNVLCEKPMVLKKAEAEELFSIAEAEGVVLMEAVKTAYGTGFLDILALAKSGRIGKICDVEASFTKLDRKNFAGREFTSGTGGSFTELATYPLLPIVKLLGPNYSTLHFESLVDKQGLDLYTKAFFTYPKAMATAKVGLGVKSEGELIISGTEGYILVESPWWLTQSFELRYEDFKMNEKRFAKWDGYGLRYELADFVRAVQGGNTDSYKLCAEDSIAMAGMMELFLAQRTKAYPPECRIP